MVKVESSSNFSKANGFLEALLKVKDEMLLNSYGEKGVEALRLATPKDTGKTSESWKYRVESNKNGTYKIVWTNSNRSEGVCIALLIQYGHATQNGSWVEGIDYINPALKPVFDQMEKDALSEVIKAHEHNY